MRLAYEVKVDGTVFKDWSRLEVTRGGVNVTVTIQATDPWWTAALGSTITVRLGRELAGGPELIDLVEGRIVGKSRVQRWKGDALRILVDGSDTRLLVSAEKEIKLRHQSLEDILHRIYVTELGFADCQTNLPPAKIEEVVIPITQGLHAAAQSLVGALSPKTWREPISDVWCVMDTRRPFPAGWPARALPLASTLVISDDTPPPTHINQVLITYPAGSEIGDETGLHPYIDVSRTVSDDQAPAGYPESKTTERIRQYYEDPSDPTRITREVQISETIEDFDGEHHLVMRTENTYTYVAGTFDALIERTETDKWVRVTLPGGSGELVRCRYDDQRQVWIPTGVGRERQQIARYGKISGEVLEPDLVPLDEGSRDGLTGEDARQTSRWMPIEHSHDRIVELGGQTVTTRTTWLDLPPYGVKRQIARDSIGNARSDPAQATATYPFTDDASIANPAIGRRPQVGFDGVPYGLELSKEIVRSHLFGGFAAVQRTATATLDRMDPTWHEGVVVLATDRQGTTSRWLVESVTDELAPAEKVATTKLSLVELREAE